jgi:hypothetical protein
MKNLASQILSGVFIAIGSIPITWFCFGPVAGFHHMYAYGLTWYMVLNGEDPQPGDHMWGDFAVHFFWGRFVVSVVLWVIAIYILAKLARLITRKNHTARPLTPPSAHE